jgi:Ca-activated chloride channel family protein
MSSFLHPGRLWLLIGVAALAVLYLALQRRRRHAAARYADPELLAAIAPARLGGRRHVPMALALTGLATLVVALAQPTRAEAVAREEGVVVLAVDVSASMEAVDVSPSRMAAAIDGATEFVEDVPDGIHVGLVAFDGGARVLVTPTTDHDAVLDAIAGLTTGEGTAAGEGVYASLDAISAALTDDVLESGDDLPAAVVLLSDGATTVGRPVEQAAAAAAELGIPITTIAFGTPTGTVTVRGETVRVPADTETMAEVADVTGGRAYQATTAGELADVYTDISTVVGTTTEQREVTRVAVGAALVLVASATALAVLWGARAL